jgi:hypothetical protein
VCRRPRGTHAINAPSFEGLIGHECYATEVLVGRSGLAPRCGSVPDVVKCGRLFMASQYGAGRGIHSSGSLSTRSTTPVRFRHA